MEKGAKATPPILDDLDDHIWIEAANTVVELGRELERGLGRKPTCDEYCFFLARALQSTQRELFSDVSTAGVVGLKAIFAKVPKKVSPGTVIGVPTGEGDVFPVLYLTSNTFGDAFGVFRGAYRRLTRSWKFKAAEKPIYSSLRPLREGRWIILDARPDLVTLFSANPEIYHRKSGYNEKNPMVGPYGSAETADGKIRNISKDEAEDVGLLNNDYRQVLMEKEFVAYLKQVNKK